MPEDDDLYGRAASGDGQSLDRLLERYLPQLHAYVRLRLGPELRARESSVDVVQSVCRELLSQRGRFDFRGEERFRAWLFTSALNKLRDKHRFHHWGNRDVRKEAGTVGGHEHALAATLMGSPSQGAMAAEAERIVREAIDALSEDHREVLTLARIVGLPHKVIAEVMERTEAATRQLLGRALVQFGLEVRRRGLTDG